MNILETLEQLFSQAMLAADIPAEFGPHIALSKKAGFGDYQANGAMAAAKQLKTNPRELAQKILDQLDIGHVAEKVDIAGPGFINIHLRNDWLAKQLQTVGSDPHLGITPATEPKTVVVDYSSPNLAKEMHVGHLRSTIIGDAIVRILEFVGHKVIRQNHVGDWGTQFGMLIAELETHLSEGEQAELALKDLESFYQQAKKHFDENSNFADRARDYVVKLQSGDQAVLQLWQNFKDISLQHANDIYQALNVTLAAEDVRGESAYNHDLAVLVDELKNQELSVTDNGAQVVFLEELADKNGEPSPVIVQKQDGGYLYATTDLAAIRYRAQQLNADRILYFIDARQSLHMQQVFTLARKAGFVADKVSLEHHPFGTMMGEDGKPFKTRSGGTVKLANLLTESIERASELVREKNPQLSDTEIQQIAEPVGIGAIKYADLSKTRTNDYVFKWESMLSFEGNTAPYLQYAYTRIFSIFRKANMELNDFSSQIIISEEQEKALALKLLRFSEVIEQVSIDAYPHLLCNYLYELASLFMTFYEACPILKSDVREDHKNSRLMLSKITGLTLKKGLKLLGIDVMERM